MEENRKIEAEKEMRKILSELEAFAVKYDMPHVSAFVIVHDDSTYMNAMSYETGFDVTVYKEKRAQERELQTGRISNSTTLL